MTEQSPKSRPQTKPKTRILKWVLLFLVVFIVLLIFLVPVFISSSKGQEMILAKINDSIDGRADFSSFSMGWFKGIKVAGISFNDNAGTTSVQVEQISTKPHYGSILTGSLSFGKTIIDKPRVKINLKALGETEAPASGEKKESRPVVLPVKRIDMMVNDGRVEVTSREGQTVELSNINSKLNLQPLGRQTDFDVDLTVADKSKESELHADGRVTPGKRTGWSLEGTSGELAVEINDLDLESLGPVFALAGIEVRAKGNVFADLKSEIKDGRLENLNGTVSGKDVDVTTEELKGDSFKTSTLDVVVKLARKDRMINIDNLEVHADWLKAQAGGDVPTTFDSLAEFIKADSKQNLKASFECDIAQLASQMPKTLGLKEGTKITSGVLAGEIEKIAQAGKGKIVAQASLTGLQGMVEARQVALSEPVRFEAEVTSDKEHIRYDKLNVSAPFAKVDCTGTSQELRYNANVNLAKLQSELGQFLDMGRYQMAGELLGQGTISGSKKLISTSGSSVISNLRLSSKDGVSVTEPKADVVFAFEVDRKSNVVNVDSVTANASFGQVGSQNAVLPLNDEAAKPMNLPIGAKVDLAKIQPFLVLFGVSQLKNMQLAGVADSTVSISSEKGTYKVKTDATKIKDFKLASEQQKTFGPDDVSLVLDAEVNPKQQTVNVKKLRLESSKIKINKAEITHTTKNGKTKLDGHIDCEYDWEAVSTIVSPFTPKGLKLKGENKLPIDFSSEYPAGQSEQLLANLSTKSKLGLGFEQAEYMGLKFSSTEAKINIQKGLLTIEPFSTTVNNGQLNFAAQADFKKDPALLKVPEPMQIAKNIQINDEVSEKLLKYMNPIFANNAGVSGLVNFNCERLAIPLRGGNKNHLQTAGTISIDKLELRARGLIGQIFSFIGARDAGIFMKIHPTRFVLQNGILEYDDMQLDVGDNPVNFKGAIGLDKSIRNMSVTLPYTSQGRTARVGEKTVGKRITLPIKGTIDNPEIDMSGLLEGQIKERLGDELKDRLGDELGDKALDVLEELLKKKE